MNKCVYLTFILKSQICVNYDLKQLLNISIRIDDIILGTYWLNVSIWLNNNNGFIIIIIFFNAYILFIFDFWNRSNLQNFFKFYTQNQKIVANQKMQ